MRLQNSYFHRCINDGILTTVSNIIVKVGSFQLQCKLKAYSFPRVSAIRKLWPEDMEFLQADVKPRRTKQTLILSTPGGLIGALSTLGLGWYADVRVSII